MPESTLTSKGQTTIPGAVRKHLKLASGDQIDFVIQKDGSVLIRPATMRAGETRGILHRKGMKAVPVHEMNDAIRKRFRAGR